MSNEAVTVASSARDAQLAEAVVSHHAAMTGEVGDLVGRVVAAVDAGEDPRAARDELAAYFTAEVLPHAKAEESTLYEAAAGIHPARMLIETMTIEHGLIAEAIAALERAESAGSIAAAAGVLDALFTGHVGRENDFVIPLLAADASVSLAGLVEGLHELIGGDSDSSVAGSSGKGDGCGCGCSHG